MEAISCCLYSIRSAKVLVFLDLGETLMLLDLGAGNLFEIDQSKLDFRSDISELGFAPTAELSVNRIINNDQL